MPLLLIQVGTPPDTIRLQEGDLSDWFKAALNLHDSQLEVVRVFEGERLPPPCDKQPAVITGSWSMVTDRLDWSEETADWIRRAMLIEQPLFGVCYGHQLMSHALGGQVDFHPDGIEIGCLPVELLPGASQDPLLGNLPSQFDAYLTHMQSVTVPPPAAVVLARSAHDSHQILRYGPNAVSTQFHPEFTSRIMAACVDRRAEMLRSTGRVPEAIKTNAGEANHTLLILRHFVSMHLNHCAVITD